MRTLTFPVAIAYLAAAVLLLIIGGLIGGTASGLFITGQILLGAFIPLLVIYFFLCGILRIG